MGGQAVRATKMPASAKASIKAAKVPAGAKTKYIPAGEFKAQCLKLMDEVEATGGEIVITKRGKPVAKLMPVEKKRKSSFGCMKGTIEILGDIMEPVIPWDEEAWLKNWDELLK